MKSHPERYKMLKHLIGIDSILTSFCSLNICQVCQGIPVQVETLKVSQVSPEPVVSVEDDGIVGYDKT